MVHLIAVYCATDVEAESNFLLESLAPCDTSTRFGNVFYQ